MPSAPCQVCHELGACDERIALVSHGDFLLLVMRSFYPRPLNLCWNASLTHIDIRRNIPHLVTYACTSHLPNYLVTW